MERLTLTQRVTLKVAGFFLALAIIFFTIIGAAIWFIP